ncbi:MAG: sigma-70 family RNA polymerase sigma factor [Planctomycetota bacterium]
MAPSHEPTIDALLAEADWVRALARALVDRDDLADDAAQEVWLAALQAPAPPRESGRGWLGQVARNVVRKTFRAESRRNAREEAVAREEEQPSTLDVVERFSTQQAVGTAVLALEEPYRETVLLRFYEELGLREIAERTGVAVSTVDWRIRRALGELRGALDREAGGDRRRTSLALVALARLDAPASPAPLAAQAALGSSARLGALAATIIVLAGAAALLALRAASRPEHPPAMHPGSLAVADSPERVRPSDTALAASASAGGRSPAADAIPPGSATAPSAALHLTLLTADGRPAAGVPVRIEPDRTQAGAHAPSIGRTGSDGRLRVAGLPACAHSVTVPFGVEVCPAQRVELRPGEPTSLDVVLPEGPTLAGIVVDVDGDPVVGAALWASASPPSIWVGGTSVEAIVDDLAVARTDDGGRFEVPSIGAARIVGVLAEGHAPSLTIDVSDRARPRIDLRIVLPGAGAPVEGRVLDEDGAPVEGAAVLIDAMESEVPPVAAPLLRTTTDALGRYRFLSVRAGSRRLHAVAPGLASGRATISVGRESVRDVEITLPRGARVFGCVVDADGGPVADAVVFAARRRWWSPPDARHAVVARTDARGEYELRAVTPGALWLTVEAGSRGRFQELSDERIEGDTRLDVTLDPGLVLRGTVIDDAGEPLAGCEVRCAAVGDWRGRATWTDAAGGFSFTNCDEVAFRLQVAEGGVVVARVSAEQAEGEVTVVVASASRPSAVFVGALAGADGEPARASRLRVTDAATGRSLVVPVGAARPGVFRSNAVPPGRYTVELLTASGEVLAIPEEWTLAPSATVDLGPRRLPATGLVVLEVDPQRERLDARLLDASGEVVRRWSLEAPSAHAPPTAHVPPGRYALVVDSSADVSHEVPVLVEEGATAVVPVAPVPPTPLQAVPAGGASR